MTFILNLILSPPRRVSRGRGRPRLQESCRGTASVTQEGGQDAYRHCAPVCCVLLSAEPHLRAQVSGIHGHHLRGHDHHYHSWKSYITMISTMSSSSSSSSSLSPQSTSSSSSSSSSSLSSSSSSLSSSSLSSSSSSSLSSLSSSSSSSSLSLSVLSEIPFHYHNQCCHLHHISHLQGNK